MTVANLLSGPFPEPSWKPFVYRLPLLFGGGGQARIPPACLPFGGGVTPSPSPPPLPGGPDARDRQVQQRQPPAGRAHGGPPGAGVPLPPGPPPRGGRDRRKLTIGFAMSPGRVWMWFRWCLPPTTIPIISISPRESRPPCLRVAGPRRVPQLARGHVAPPSRPPLPPQRLSPRGLGPGPFCRAEPPRWDVLPPHLPASSLCTSPRPPSTFLALESASVRRRVDCFTPWFRPTSHPIS